MATTSIRVSNSIVALVVETRLLPAFGSSRGDAATTGIRVSSESCISRGDVATIPAFGFLVIVAEVVETRLPPLSFFTGRIPFLPPN